MDLILLLGIASALLVVGLTLWLFTRKSSGKESKSESQPARRINRNEANDADIPRRAQIARNQRRNAPQNTANANEDSDDSDGESTRPNPFAEAGKMGAKKRAKLEAKAEKRQQREQELVAREEKKKKDALAEIERKKTEQAEENEEKKREEAERKIREEKERKEHEEYLKLKASFTVEEEGYEECSDDEKEDLLKRFIDHIKEKKVVVLEELATQFKLKTQAAIERITDLQADGTITGVIDDQGKFIYISEQELRAVSEFIRQRGRVSITDLVESSNNLINMKSVEEAATNA